MGKIFSEGLIMRRAVITGLGIVSSIGNNKDEVTTSLREGRSGITFSEEFEQAGMRSQVWGGSARPLVKRPQRHERKRHHSTELARGDASEGPISPSIGPAQFFFLRIADQ